MKGLGFDLCGIDRFRDILRQGDGFLKRYYTSEEEAYIHSRGNAAGESAAALFAAKEAFLKALGTGIDGKIPLKSIGVTHNAQGAPSYALGEEAANALQERGITQAWLTLTHDAGVAGAVCVLE